MGGDEVMTEREREIKKTKAEREKLLKRLNQMAFGSANDVAKLALNAGELMTEELEGLDLTMLSEIKRAQGGAVEVKLINRLEVIKLLLQELEPVEVTGGGAAELIAAIGDAAKGAEIELSEN
jgi:hypothetical protein